MRARNAPNRLAPAVRTGGDSMSTAATRAVVRRLILRVATGVILGMPFVQRSGAETRPDGHAFEVTADWPRASPEAVEREVTIPIENALASLPGVSRVRSNSWEGRSQTIVEYRSSAKVDDVEREIRDRVERIKPTLPEAVGVVSIARRAA